MEHVFYLNTKIGTVGIAENGSAITKVFFCNEPCSGSCKTPLLQNAALQLEEYLAGTRREFDLPLAPKGTPFQQAIWKALLDIPYGDTRSYAQIAHAVGNPKACRAVGMANHNNPIAVIIPCHRVIGKNGKLTGYAGGIDKKDALLLLEQKNQNNTEEEPC